MAARVAIALVSLCAAVGIYAQPSERDHVQLVNETPCLFEYRSWYFAFRRSNEFPVPAGFTREQCDEAARISDRIQAEQADGVAGALQRHYEEIARSQAAAAAEQARSQAEAERDFNALLREMERIRRSYTRAQPAKSTKPGVRIGMTPEQVVNETSWGKPIQVRKTTTQNSRSEHWIYPGQNHLFFENGKLVTIMN